MAYNPWNKRPPVLPQMTREFVLSSSGDTLSLTLKKLGSPQQTEVFELAERLEERYITGDQEFVDSKGVSGTGPVLFREIGGFVTQPNKTMILAACMLQIMQEGPAEDLLDADAWIAFQIVEEPRDWLAVQKFSNEVARLGAPASKKVADVPNGSGADTSTSSGPPSIDTSSIPSLLPE